MITTMTMILGQINTEPMVSQIGMLSVVEAPDILYNQVNRWFFRFICFFFISLDSGSRYSLQPGEEILFFLCCFPFSKFLIFIPSEALDILYNQLKRYFFLCFCCCFPFFNFLILFNRRHSIFFTTRRRDDILQSSYFLSPTDQLILFMNDVLSNFFLASDLFQMLA